MNGVWPDTPPRRPFPLRTNGWKHLQETATDKSFWPVMPLRFQSPWSTERQTAAEDIPCVIWARTSTLGNLTLRKIPTHTNKQSISVFSTSTTENLLAHIKVEQLWRMLTLISASWGLGHTMFRLSCPRNRLTHEVPSTKFEQTGRFYEEWVVTARDNAWHTAPGSLAEIECFDFLCGS